MRETHRNIFYPLFYSYYASLTMEMVEMKVLPFPQKNSLTISDRYYTVKRRVRRVKRVFSGVWCVGLCRPLSCPPLSLPLSLSLPPVLLSIRNATSLSQKCIAFVLELCRFLKIRNRELRFLLPVCKMGNCEWTWFLSFITLQFQLQINCCKLLRSWMTIL